MTERFVHHNHAERFDAVTVDTVERWKESELSGDEWRFSYLVKFWRRGEVMTQVGAGSVEEACLVAAYQYSHTDLEGAPGGYLGDISDLCAQPACPDPWTILLHPVNRYNRQGTLIGPYYEDDVRGFCDRHRHRGDCGLDDNDRNYTVVRQR